MTSFDYFKVAVDAPLNNSFEYKAEPSRNIEVGQAVSVPFGTRKAFGVVIEKSIEKMESTYEVKEIGEIHSDFPRLSESFLKWLHWLSKYYAYPFGQVVGLAYPPLSKKSDQKATKSKKSSLFPEVKDVTPPRLTPEQEKCLKEISESDGFQAHLIFGVTGSGKTEIYLRLLEKVLKEGKQAVVLVPEIALTPQLIRRFAERFGPQIAVYHSHLTPREKTNQWWEMVDGTKKILIGARSALFCPIPNLGMVILDEEHEPSFKQEETFKYHARDAAVMLAKSSNCKVILGSATPSAESWLNAKEGRYHLHTLKERVEGRPLPTMEVVDLRIKKEEKAKGESETFWLSEALKAKIQQRLDLGEQSALFLNRRGAAQFVLCPGCGATKQCPNCSVSLTLHGKQNLVCHYCNYQEDMPETCPECKISELKPLGVGTELIERDLAKLFPKARIERADRDRVGSREDLESLISKMENKEIDILVGTQMIAKGLDFENLTLVGIILADIGFNIPDFRASERSFELLMQMSGRAGRHKRPGEVIIQSYNLEHSSIEFAVRNDYVGFMERELGFRKDLMYPPYGRLAGIRLQGLHLDKVVEASHQLFNRGEAIIKKFGVFSGLEILGPAEAPLAKLRGQHRYHLLIKAPKHNLLSAFCEKLVDVKLAGVKISIDIDPLHML